MPEIGAGLSLCGERRGRACDNRAMTKEIPTVILADLKEEFRGTSISIWSYRTRHGADDLLKSDYWQLAASRFSFGDRIMVDCTGGTANQHYTLVVTQKGKTIKVCAEALPSVR